MGTTTMNTTRPQLHLVPLRPAGASYGEHRALGMGHALVLAELSTAGGFPISVVDLGRLDAESPLATVLAEGDPAADWHAVGGSYDTDAFFPVELAVVDVAARREVERRLFEVGESFGAAVGAVREWLAGLGAGIAASAVDEPQPADAAQARMLAHLLGLGWLIATVDSAVDAEFLETWEVAREVLEAGVGGPFLDRRLPLQLVGLSSAMIAKALPVTGGVEEPLLIKLAQQLEPAGMEHVHALLARGIERGSDPLAYRTCRGKVRLQLGSLDAAREDFEVVREELPRFGWLGIAQLHTATQRWDDAIDAIDQASDAGDPSEGFRLLEAGRDAESPLGAPSWGGYLLTERGEVALRAGRFESAVESLERALEAGGNERRTCELLAQALRNWGLEVLPRDPKRGRAHLEQHVAVLDRIFTLDPRIEEVRAALSVADYFDDAKMRSRWQARADDLVPGG